VDVDSVYDRTVHQKSSTFCKSKEMPGATFKAQPEVVELENVDSIIKEQKSAVNRFIILQPKNTLVFPLAHNPRFPVSDDDIMHFSAIVELAYTNRIQKYVMLIVIF
jgi:hypothetical protein